MRKANITTLLSLVLCAVVATGCVGNNFCAKRQECDNDLEDDSYSVCVENYNGTISALRANKEQECQDLAAAKLAYDACRASLDCNNFDDENQDPGSECENEYGDYQNAIDDADLECTTFD